jgi:hypothetical protein
MNAEYVIGLQDGGFAVALQIAEATAELASMGAKYAAQRVGAVDEILGCVERVDGKLVRTGIRRADVGYTEEKATRLEAALNAELEKLGITAVIEPSVADTPTVKFASERRMLKDKVAAGKPVEAIAKTIRFDGDTGTVEEPEVEFLAAIKEFLKGAI